MKNDTNLTFYSPNGVPWEIKDQEVKLDRQRLMTIPVRRYFHELAEYTILACADYDYPHRIFYDLGIKLSDVRCPAASFATNIRILKEMMKKSPIPMARYMEAERKLLGKAEKRRAQFVGQIKQQMVEKNKPTQESVGDIECKNGDSAIFDVANDDDDEFSGGVLGVYGRSEIHAEYTDKVNLV